MEQITKVIINNKEYSIRGDSVFVRYSAKPDGTNFTEERREEQNYMGVAVGQEAPTDKDSYEWIPIIPNTSKSYYNMMAELHKDDATFIPWITEPEVSEEGDDIGGAESLYDYLLNKKGVDVGTKNNVAFPPTFAKIPRVFDDFGGDRKMWHIDNIWIPSTVTTIGMYAFECCYGTILIPTSVKNIEYMAFYPREYLDDEQEGNEYEEDFEEGDYFPVTIDLTEFKTEPFPVAEEQYFDECIMVKVCKGRGAELAAMTNWAEWADNIVEV